MAKQHFENDTLERKNSIILADHYSDEAYHAYSGKPLEMSAMEQAHRMRQAGLIESRTYTKELMSSNKKKMEAKNRTTPMPVILSVGGRSNK